MFKFPIRNLLKNNVITYSNYCFKCAKHSLMLINSLANLIFRNFRISMICNQSDLLNFMMSK